MHWAHSPTWGSISQAWNHDLSWSQELGINRLSHPGIPISTIWITLKPYHIHLRVVLCFWFGYQRTVTLTWIWPGNLGEVITTKIKYIILIILDQMKLPANTFPWGQISGFFLRVLILVVKVSANTSSSHCILLIICLPRQRHPSKSNQLSPQGLTGEGSQPGQTAGMQTCATN